MVSCPVLHTWVWEWVFHEASFIGNAGQRCSRFRVVTRPSVNRAHFFWNDTCGRHSDSKLPWCGRVRARVYRRPLWNFLLLRRLVVFSR